jgi:hypothetical protein
VAQQQPAPPTARATAPFDITGYWVSVVTEDWRWRMVTPSKGDAISIPVNAQGQQAANAWDYAKDMAAGNQCKAYGAGGLMRLPTRLHITWQDDNTLKLETDAGQQTQLFHFDRSQAPLPAAGRTPQGTATAQWIDVVAAGRGGGGRGGRGGAAAGAAGGAPGGAGAPAFGTGGMTAVITNLSAGYLRKNGVPYSENAVVTEYFDRVPGPATAQWLVIKTIVDDPAFLAQAYITSSHFKLEPDGSKWRPTPCEVDPPLIPGRSQTLR